MIAAVLVIASPPGATSKASPEPRAPENGRIVFSMWGYCEPLCYGPQNPNLDLWTIGSDGLTPLKLTHTPGVELFPEWSPDGESIAYTANHGGNFDIYVTDPLGLETQQLTDHPQYDLHPTWSPDGTKIAFVRGHGREAGIFVMRSDGSASRRIALFEWPVVPHDLRWSPTGSWIVFSLSDRRRWLDQSTPDGFLRGPMRLVIVHADGRGRRRLPTGGLQHARSPSWSPSGREIAFIGARSCGAVCNKGVWVMRLDGSNLRRLATGPGDEGVTSVAWSPDGSEIVYVRTAHVYGSDLWVAAIDGSNQRPLLAKPDTWEQTPHWQPIP